MAKDLARSLNGPTEEDVKRPKHLLGRIKGALHSKMASRHSTTLPAEFGQGVDLHVFLEANWAGCPSMRKSTSGALLLLCDRPMHFVAKRKSLIALPSVESSMQLAPELEGRFMFDKLLRKLNFIGTDHCDHLRGEQEDSANTALASLYAGAVPEGDHEASEGMVRANPFRDASGGLGDQVCGTPCIGGQGLRQRFPVGIWRRAVRARPLARSPPSA